MTAPTPLAETIARLRELLPAFEAVGELSVLTLPKYVGLRKRAGETSDADVFQVAAFLAALLPRLPVLLDAASEHAALAKRVGELEAENERLDGVLDELRTDPDPCLPAHLRLGRIMDKLSKAEAESTRLRAENERLAEDAAGLRAVIGVVETQSAHVNGLLTAAQDRVRALDLANDELRTAAEDEARNGDILHAETETLRDRVRELEGELSRLRVASVAAIRETVTGPITDPTQGVGTLGIDWAVPGSERTMETIIDHTGAVVSCRERPSFIPATCQHFEKLPSGLWAWVQDGDVFFEASESYVVHSGMAGIDYEQLGGKYRAHIDKPDFLAARALGVRVLGWKK